MSKVSLRIDVITDFEVDPATVKYEAEEALFKHFGGDTSIVVRMVMEPMPIPPPIQKLQECGRCENVHKTDGLSEFKCEDCERLIPNGDLFEFRCTALDKNSVPRCCNSCADRDDWNGWV